MSAPDPTTPVPMTPEEIPGLVAAAWRVVFDDPVNS
jgi:hypothetical protein